MWDDELEPSVKQAMNHDPFSDEDPDLKEVEEKRDVKPRGSGWSRAKKKDVNALSPREQECYEAVTHYPRFTAKDVAKIMGVTVKSAGSNYIHKLMGKGKIQRIAPGVYTLAGVDPEQLPPTEIKKIEIVSTPTRPALIAPREIDDSRYWQEQAQMWQDRYVKLAEMVASK